MPLSDLFIKFVPMYDKFRAPSSILVLVELLFPLIAIVGLYRFFNDEKLTEEYKQKILIYVSGSVLGITLLLVIFGKSLLGFATSNETAYLPPYLLDYLVGERFTMFRIDAIKAVSYTHLDVYKRQALAYANPVISGKQLLQHDIVPVSYTHLDVYKRQMICSKVLFLQMLVTFGV